MIPNSPIPNADKFEQILATREADADWIAIPYGAVRTSFVCRNTSVELSFVVDTHSRFWFLAKRPLRSVDRLWNDAGGSPTPAPC